jgi:hypothetical protein
MEWALLQHTHQGWSHPFPALDSPQTLLLVFGAPAYLEHPQALEELCRAYPQSLILGCSTAGEIIGDLYFDDSLAVAVIRFKTTRLRIAHSQEIRPGNSRQVGSELGAALNAPDLKGLFVLSDGLQVNGSELAAGLREGAGGAIITGGLAGDGTRFQRTWVLASSPGADWVLDSGTIAAVGFYGGSIHLAHGFRGGWTSFGLERKITKSRSNILYELDGRPALELYKTYLGDLASSLPAAALLFPIAIRTQDPLEPQIVRTILAVDETEQSLTFAGDVPEGSSITLMRCDMDRLVTGARIAAASCAVRPEAPVLALAISCVGRRLVLGERTEEELEASLDALPPGSAQVGFYSYGELSPVSGGECRLHNQTMTLTTLQEC